MKGRLYHQAGKQTRSENTREELVKWDEGKPTRYLYEKRPLKRRKGMTKRRYLIPVAFGHPRYDEAPFEMAVIMGPKLFTSAPIALCDTSA